MSLGTILLVPGIAGNEILTPPSVFGTGPPLRIWLDYASLLAGGWRLLGLSRDGITPNVPLTGTLQAGAPLGDYYGLMMAHLAGLGWEVIGSRIDWRLTLERNGQHVADSIRALSAAGPVHLLAHSRGGLVCREACRQLGASGQLGLVARSAGLGVPHYGAWESLGSIGGWNRNVHQLETFLGPGATGVNILGTLGYVLDVVQTWPGTYALLPAPNAPGVTPAQIAKLYDPAHWTAEGRELPYDWLATQPDRWESLPMIPAQVDWIDVVGTGTLTRASWLPPYGVASGTGYIFTALGDGTVTTMWGVQPGRRRITTPTAHLALCYDRRLIDALSVALRDGLTADLALPGPVLT